MAGPIVHEREGTRGAFAVRRDGERVGELLYSLEGTRMTVHHTEVSPALRNSGLARELVQAAVEHARAERLTLVPRCSYVRAVLARTPAWQDVREG